MIQIVPSILSADLTRLGDQVRGITGARVVMGARLGHPVTGLRGDSLLFQPGHNLT